MMNEHEEALAELRALEASTAATLDEIRTLILHHEVASQHSPHDHAKAIAGWRANNARSWRATLTQWRDDIEAELAKAEPGIPEAWNEWLDLTARVRHTLDAQQFETGAPLLGFKRQRVGETVEWIGTLLIRGETLTLTCRETRLLRLLAVTHERSERVTRAEAAARIAQPHEQLDETAIKKVREGLSRKFQKCGLRLADFLAGEKGHGGFIGLREHLSFREWGVFPEKD